MPETEVADKPALSKPPLLDVHKLASSGSLGTIRAYYYGTEHPWLVPVALYDDYSARCHRRRHVVALRTAGVGPVSSHGYDPARGLGDAYGATHLHAYRDANGHAEPDANGNRYPDPAAYSHAYTAAHSYPHTRDLHGGGERHAERDSPRSRGPTASADRRQRARGSEPTQHRAGADRSPAGVNADSRR